MTLSLPLSPFVYIKVFLLRSPLVSFKGFLVEEIGVEPIPLDFQSNASTELASLPLFVLTVQRYKKYLKHQNLFLKNSHIFLSGNLFFFFR